MSPNLEKISTSACSLTPEGRPLTKRFERAGSYSRCKLGSKSIVTMALLDASASSDCQSLGLKASVVAFKLLLAAR